MAEQLTLRGMIDRFLNEEILSKPEEERSKRDELLIETGRAFSDVLLRHESAQGSHEPEAKARTVDGEVTALLRGYNEINRSYDLKNQDVAAINHFRNNGK